MMRPFTQAEERALVALLEPPAGAYLDVTRRRPSTFRRMANSGLVTLVLHKRQTRARLTQTGRYYADLVKGSGVAAFDEEWPFGIGGPRKVDGRYVDVAPSLDAGVHADPA